MDAQLSSVLFEFREFSKQIDVGPTMALRDATGQVVRGEFVAVVGTSGSGKTTLLSILGLLDRPTSGSYMFDSVDVSDLDEATRNQFRGQRIGFIFQNSFLIAEETVGDNVALGLRVRGVDRATQIALVESVLDRVGLADAIDKRAGDLSGGEKQRVAVARAIVTAPDVILADEPTGALDTTSTRHLISLLQEITSSGTTVVVVTHDPLVAAAADRNIEIVDGVTQPSPTGSLDSLPLGKADGAEPQDSVGYARPSIPAGSRTGRMLQEFVDAVAAPLSRPVRTLLVVFAYILGIAALVGAMGITSGATGHIVARLTAAGSSDMRVTDSSPTDQTWEYALRQASHIGTLEGVEAAVPVRSFTNVSNTVTRLQSLGTPYSGKLIITDERYFNIHHMTSAKGNPQLLSNQWNGPLVVLGATAATSLGVSDTTPGIQVWVNGRPVDVAAILNPTSDTTLDSALYFSPATNTYLTDQLDNYVLVHCVPGYAEPLAQAIPSALSPTNPGQISVTVVAQLAQLQQGINSDLSRMLTIIGWVILALSALTAGTTMFLSVQYRSPEIALRRAMGASKTSIWRIFTYEGITIGCVGGVLGTATGIGLTATIAHLNDWPLTLGLHIPLLGISIGFTAGIIASTIPALIAAQQQPASILRTI